MRNVFQIGLLLMVSSIVAAQEFVLVSVGPEYGLKSYVTLENNAETRVPNDAFDLIFHLPSGGILINESSKTTFLEPAQELRLYEAPTDDFLQPFTKEEVGQRLYNNEVNWSTGGAFNVNRSPDNANDVGWGFRTPDGVIEGRAVYALQLRDKSWKKIQIEEKNSKNYRLTLANLDNTGREEITLPLPDSDQAFLYYSITHKQLVDASPARWDIVFQRYVTPLDDNQGGILNYTVTGALIHPNVKVAQADNVQADVVAFGPYRDALQDTISTIGHDWKEFDFVNTNEWTVAAQRAYFVLDTEKKVWKIVFIDFEGTATGNIVFQKYLSGDLSATRDEASHALLPAAIFPNPSNGNFQLAFDWTGGALDTPWSILDMNGQTIATGGFALRPGLNVFNFENSFLQNGAYFLQFTTPKGRIVKRLSIVKK